jgi:type II secretory pathway pseudopilin PulG
MKKTVIGIIVIVIIVILALYFRSNMAGQTASADDTSFESEAAAILAAPTQAQVKIDLLNARLAARQARAQKIGAVVKVPPISGVNAK